MLNSKYQIFDNFLEDPDEVLEYASTCQYFTAEEYQKIDPLESVGNWPGLRSNDLQLEFPDITHKLNKMFNVRVGWLTFYQHLVSQNIGKPTPHTDVVHQECFENICANCVYHGFPCMNASFYGGFDDRLMQLGDTEHYLNDTNFV